MGDMDVPVDAYYGAQTRRAELNFEISPLRAPRALIRAMGLIKKAAAQVNMDLRLLNPDLGSPIVQAAQAVADGKHDDQFVVDIFQTGSGTSTNMNTNEVIAGIANEKFNNGVRGGKSPVHPNDAVNMGQSSNDVIPTAIHVAALEGVRKKLIPVLENLQKLLLAKAKEFDPIVKIGRTHLQDAVPIPAGPGVLGIRLADRARCPTLDPGECLSGRTRYRRDGRGDGDQYPRRLSPVDDRAAQSRYRAGLPTGRQLLRGDGQP